MIAELKPYAEQQPTGSKWLGECPAHWEVRNLRTLIRPRNERNRPDLPLLTVARERGVFVRSLTDPTENHNVIPDDLSNYKVARSGDLVINKMKAWQGSMGIAPCNGIVSPAYYVFDLGIEDARFGEKLLRSKPYVAHFGQASDGVRVGQWDLSITGMRQIPVLVPPPAEQTAIVRFLDHWNVRLEKAIRAKRRVIALLQEQKQAIIHRAVTRGLDTNVKIKDSGIPWLGEIPAHWEVYRLSFLADFSNGKAHEQFFDPDGEFVCVNARFVSTGGTGIKYSTRNFWPARRGDVLMVMSDLPNGRALARAYLVNDDRKYAVNQRVCRLRPKRVEAGFLAYAANRNYGLLRHDDGSNQTHLSTGDYKTLPIQCPPRDEQQAIIRYLDAHVSKADIRINHLEREITLLREYRTRLTADVVTGKLDVRAAAAQLPDPEQQPGESEAVEIEEETEMEEVEG